MSLFRVCRRAAVAIATGLALASPAHADWWLLGRYSQGQADYSFQNQDTLFKGSSSAVVDLAGIELRYRERHEGSRLWKFAMSLQLETMREVFLSETYLLPRARARFSFGTESFITERWRVAPTLQLAATKGLVVDAQGNGVVNRATITRPSVALGLELGFRMPTLSIKIGSFRKEWLELSALGLLRYDSGASATILPNPMADTLAVQWELGALVWIGNHTFFETRARAEQEVYAWPAATNNSLQNSAQSQFLLFDFALGWKF